MLQGKKILAFIGARSGSKGLKNKNIKPLHGKPLINWTIEAALASKYIDKVVVSTDSQQYADIAQKAEAMIRCRPSELATDDASLMDALVDTVGSLNADNDHYDIVVNLQPTSPLRTSVHIDEALTLYFEHAEDSEKLRVFSCYQLPEKYAWVMRQNADNYAYFIEQEARETGNHARQNNPNIYMPNGAIFILPSSDLTNFYNSTSMPYVMPESASIDIDTLADFECAEKLMESLS